jgi:hypothetical protein
VTFSKVHWLLHNSSQTSKGLAMYQAIEAISTAGVIRPLEPILFDKNEHLVILRLSKTYVGTAVARTPSADWKRWAGVLKDSPNLNDDPVAIQQAMRHEWD